MVVLAGSELEYLNIFAGIKSTNIHYAVVQYDRVSESPSTFESHDVPHIDLHRRICIMTSAHHQKCYLQLPQPSLALERAALHEGPVAVPVRGLHPGLRPLHRYVTDNMSSREFDSTSPNMDGLQTVRLM